MKQERTFNQILSSEDDFSNHTEYLTNLSVKYPWFTMAKVALIKSLNDNKKSKQAEKLKKNISLSTIKYNYFNLLNKKVDTTPERFRKRNGTDIVDSFLKTPYKRKKPPRFADDYEIEDLSIKTAEKSEIISEDLANIYVKQQLFNEAINIYRKLILINPEKNVYFASRIDELLKLISTNNVKTP